MLITIKINDTHGKKKTLCVNDNDDHIFFKWPIKKEKKNDYSLFLVLVKERFLQQ